MKQAKIARCLSALLTLFLLSACGNTVPLGHLMHLGDNGKTIQQILAREGREPAFFMGCEPHGEDMHVILFFDDYYTTQRREYVGSAQDGPRRINYYQDTERRHRTYRAIFFKENASGQHISYKVRVFQQVDARFFQNYMRQNRCQPG